jgi:N,N'-diacetyllegionaminate synthase
VPVQTDSVHIAGRDVGTGHSVFVIAEAGVNHNGEIGLALELIDIAADSGADAVKFQTLNADLLVTTDSPKAAYAAETTEEEMSNYEMIKGLELTEADHRTLQKHCGDRGVIFISTPFDEPAADFLETLDVPAYKTGSGEVNNIPYLKHVASKGKPVIFSTGMSTMEEVEQAVAVMEAQGNSDIIVLHCVSNYPANPADANLRAMETIRQRVGKPVGYSDHTMGTAVPLAAVAMGASLIEKHFTLDRSMEGPDHRASLEPDELKRMIEDIRTVESSLGDGVKRLMPSEQNTLDVARRSLVARRNLTVGEKLEAGSLVALRPGTGIPPSELEAIVGRSLIKPVNAGALLTRNDFE